MNTRAMQTTFHAIAFLIISAPLVAQDEPPEILAQSGEVIDSAAGAPQTTSPLYDESGNIVQETLDGQHVHYKREGSETQVEADSADGL